MIQPSILKHPTRGPITVKLGKKAPVHDRRTLKIGKYLKALPPPPATAGYIKQVSSYGMYLNDALGDCVVAAMAHTIQRWNMYARHAVTPTDNDILQVYEKGAGYVPGDPSTDNGWYLLDALKYWQQNGLGGHKVVAYASVNPHTFSELRQVIDLFGHTFIGLELPIYAQSPLIGVNGLPCWNAPPNLDGDNAPLSWGGHCVDLGGYGADAKGNTGFELITWGQIYDCTKAFLGAYCDEAWVAVTQDWIESDKKSPSGFDLPTLLQDLTQVTVSKP